MKVSKLLGQRWKALDSKSKDAYTKLAADNASQGEKELTGA